MKSHEQDLLTVCYNILMDITAKCFQPLASMTRDFMQIKKRVTYEGLSFLTITLPDFGKDFERCLDCGQVTSLHFHGWKKWRSLPAFLQGLTKLIFDAGTGRLLDTPDIAAIEGIRQIAYSFKKLSLPCTPERESMALSGFKEVERFLSRTMLPRDSNLFTKITDLLWGNIFAGSFDPYEYIPKHGPGQTAEYISGNRKYTHRTWYERLEPFFPADIHLMSCVTQLFDDTDGIECVQFVREEDELPVRVVSVPKTLKGPRIIAIEPVCMQYAQQALASFIIKKLETSRITAGHINFTDQTVNQKLAISASSDRKSATLDLSEASDRVPLSLASAMFNCNPDLRDAILACRSRAAQLPSGEIIHLKKFASMGSALCFPIESMYFYTVILVALFRKHKLPVTLRNLYRLSRGVYIYGDDIVIPVNEVDVVSETLAEYYCKVNTTKSFWTGKFRESCGMDAYDGECVTPTYLRQLQPTDKGNTSALISWIATSNLFYKRGYWKTADYMKNIVESFLGSLPVIEESSPGVGWFSYQNGFQFDRWSRTLHRFEVSTYIVSPVYQNDPLSSWSALLKFFLHSSRRSINDVREIDQKHLIRSPRSGTSSMKRRRTTPY